MREEVSFKDQLGRVKFSWPPRIPRKTITTAFVSTLGVAGLGWLVFGHEPFASKLEPVTSAVKKLMRGGRVPTVPTEDNERVIPVDGPTYPSSPKSTPLSTTGAARGQAEGRNIQGVER